MFKILFVGSKSLIISDSLTRNFPPIRNLDVITKGGATPKTLLSYLYSNQHVLWGYGTILVHVGTCWLSSKREWKIYCKYVNHEITYQDYCTRINHLNPQPAIGQADAFRADYLDLIDLIRTNTNSMVIVSAIIPRVFDHDRRNLVRISYNNILKSVAILSNTIYIRTYRPFFNKTTGILRDDLYKKDGIHLNNCGSTVLGTYFVDRIKRVQRGEITPKQN